MSASIVAGLKDLTMVGGPATTIKFAVFDAAPDIARGPVTATVDVVFGRVPGVSLVTISVMVQLPLGKVSPVKLSNPVCWSTKALLAAPPQEPAASCAPLTRIFASVSVKLPPVRGTVLLLVIVNCIVDVPSAVIVPGVKALVVIGRLSAVKLALTALVSRLADAPDTRDGSFTKVP